MLAIPTLLTVHRLRMAAADRFLCANDLLPYLNNKKRLSKLFVATVE